MDLDPDGQLGYRLLSLDCFQGNPGLEFCGVLSTSL